MGKAMVKDHLKLERKVSLSLGLLLVFTHGLAVSGIFSSAMASHYKIAFTFVVFVSLVFCLNRYCLLRDPLAVLTLTTNKSAWQLLLNSGERVPVQLEFPVFVNRYLVVMNFHDAGGRSFPVAIFSDGADATQMRHLRIFLKLGMAQPNVGGTKMVSLGVSSNKG